MARLTKQQAKEALIDKKLPILTLDHNYHQLFLEGDKNERITELEGKLSELLKRQGAINEELERLRVQKKETLKSIVKNMSDSEEADVETNKMNARSQTINDINEKIAQDEDELLDLPYRLSELNKELMVETMLSCFERMHDNVDEIAEINEWISDFKYRLKKQIIRKQNLEVVDRNMFTYMQWLFAEDVYSLFDIKQDSSDGVSSEEKASDFQKEHGERIDRFHKISEE